MNRITTKLSTLLYLLIFSVGCAGTKSSTSEKPTTPETTEPEVTEAKEITATETWHLTPANASPYYGTGVEKAYTELLTNQSPKEKVIVAIIDSGTDIEHEDLKDNIWVNENEIPNNNADDDGNGYVDDMYGWNFIGGPDSTHINKDTYEVTRLYAKMRDQYEGLSADSLAEAHQEEFAYFQEIKEAYQRRVEKNDQEKQQMGQFLMAIGSIKQMLNITSVDSVSVEELELTGNEGPQEAQAKQVMLNIKRNGITESDINDAQEYYEHVQSLAKYGLNPEFNPRDVVGDDYDDLSNRFYGNNDVSGPHNDHGTHVAGIVGAVRDNNLGALGIASNVELMIIRTVPDGDERDKDVANAIRYAAENGARVMNMSFGKGYSPQKEYVDKAIHFADSLGVLMVSGAGNGSDNVDSTDSFPSRYFEHGGFAENYLSVGATSWEPDSMLVATFSNYGKTTVDIFAPGVDVYSTYPDNTYEMQSGTSMASPVVAGVAALIMSYYPELPTAEVKEIILQTVTKPDQVVYEPGTQNPIHFSELSISGGILNAYEALKLAGERAQP